MRRQHTLLGREGLVAKILAVLHKAPKGVTINGLHRLFGDRRRNEISAALEILKLMGLASCAQVKTNEVIIETWFAAGPCAADSRGVADEVVPLT